MTKQNEPWEEELTSLPSVHVPIGLIKGKEYYYLCKEDIKKIVYKEIQRVKESAGIDIEKIKNLLPDLIEDHFPKGKCKERGQAIVLGALLITAITESNPIVWE